MYDAMGKKLMYIHRWILEFTKIQGIVFTTVCIFWKGTKDGWMKIEKSTSSTEITSEKALLKGLTFFIIQSNFSGSNTFGTMKISSRQG